MAGSEGATASIHESNVTKQECLTFTQTKNYGSYTAIIGTTMS